MREYNFWQNKKRVYAGCLYSMIKHCLTLKLYLMLVLCARARLRTYKKEYAPGALRVKLEPRTLHKNTPTNNCVAICKLDQHLSEFVSQSWIVYATMYCQT